jgi:hypothetical protein
VLVCPACQQNPSWRDDLDRCVVCGSTALLRRLGSTVCRDCEASRLNQGARATVASETAARATTAGTTTAGGTTLSGTTPRGPAGHARDEAMAAAAHREDSPGESGAVDIGHDLAREVAAAIDRVLGRA